MRELFAHIGPCGGRARRSRRCSSARGRGPRSARPATGRPRTSSASIGRWRDDLSPALQEACAEAFAAPLAAFGYEAGTRGAA